MAHIHINTFIQAPIDVVFNLSRSIDFHKESMLHTNEIAVAGITSGLINLQETVTWQATHLFRTRLLQTKITAMQPYSFFTDEMVKGDFKMMKHDHYFKKESGGTLMTDHMRFESPYGLLGKVFNAVYLTNYLQQLLITRNNTLKHYAETNPNKSFV